MNRRFPAREMLESLDRHKLLSPSDRSGLLDVAFDAAILSAWNGKFDGGWSLESLAEQGLRPTRDQVRLAVREGMRRMAEGNALRSLLIRAPNCAR